MDRERRNFHAVSFLKSILYLITLVAPLHTRSQLISFMTYLLPHLSTPATNRPTRTALMQQPMCPGSQEEDKGESLSSTFSKWRGYIASLDRCRFPDLDFGSPGSAGFDSLEVECRYKHANEWQKHGFTLPELISAAWSLILYRYTGSEQVCSASLTAVQDVTLVWIQATEISPSGSVIELLRRLREEKAKQKCFGPCTWKQFKEMGLVGEEAIFDTAVVTKSNTGGLGALEDCAHLKKEVQTKVCSHHTNPAKLC